MPIQPTSPAAGPVSPGAGWAVFIAGNPRLARWLPVLLALGVGLTFQGTRGLQETSETRYAECAREMLVSGNWIDPTLDFQPHPTKPPFAYWAMAAGMKVGGVNAWGVRGPAVLALVVTAWAAAAVGRRWWGEAVGLAAGAIVAVGFLPVAGAHVATTDAYLAAAEALAGLAFVGAATEADAARRRRLTWAMGAAWGLAFLVKGPPGLLPLLAFIPWNWMQPPERRVPLGHPFTWLLFAVVALWWYALRIARDPGLLGYFWHTEIVGRVASDEGHNSEWHAAVTVYLPCLLLALGAFGPWALGLLGRAGWWRPARWRELAAARDARWLLVLWVVLPLGVFVFSKSKLPFYLLPLALPLAVLAARALVPRVRGSTFAAIAVGSAVLLLVAKGWGAARPVWRDTAALGREARAALAELPPTAAVAVWDEPLLHGLTFYLDRPADRLLERIAAGAPGKFERWTPDAFVGRVAAGAYRDGALVVVRGEKRAAFEARCAGLPVAAETRGRFWHFLRLAPAVPPPTLAP